MTPTIEDVFNKHFKPAKQFGMADKDISRIKAAMQEWEQIQNKVKDERIKELEAWKESAMIVMSPVQEIGKAMGLQLGVSILDKVVPFIEELKKDRDWFMRAHNQLLQDNVELQNKSTKLREGLEAALEQVDKTETRLKILQLLSELKNNVS